jgi:hypothetical protein
LFRSVTQVKKAVEIRLGLWKREHGEFERGWYANAAREIIGPVLFEDTLNSESYVKSILALFFDELTKEVKT